MYEDIRTGPHHVFRIQLTLSQPEGQIMPTTVLPGPPEFSDLATGLTMYTVTYDTYYGNRYVNIM